MYPVSSSTRRFLRPSLSVARLVHSADKTEIDQSIILGLTGTRTYVGTWPRGVRAFTHIDIAFLCSEAKNNLANNYSYRGG